MTVFFNIFDTVLTNKYVAGEEHLQRQETRLGIR